MRNAEKQNQGEEAPVDSAEEAIQALNEAVDGTEDGEDILVPKKKMKLKDQRRDGAETVAEKQKEGEIRTERAAGAKKKPRRSGGRLLQSGSKRVKIGGREFSRQRLKAYGLNPKRLYFRQLGRQKRKEQEKKLKQKKKEG